MPFWGVELEPGKPFTHHFGRGHGRLHISKATLGIIGHSKERSIVQCKTGDRNPFFLVSLRRLTNESCTVGIDFDDEEGDVVFEALGPTSVHLIGFYTANGPDRHVLIETNVEDDANHDGYQEGEVGKNADMHSPECHVQTKNLLSNDGKMNKVEQPVVIYTDVEVNGLRKRTFPSGLVVEELKKVNNDYIRIVTPGNRVYIRYFGQLMSDGIIYESNIGKTPEWFQLVNGKVIKGWEIGINGMRVGDKRRLTVPPSMGYGSEEAKSVHIAPNEWLVFEIELFNIADAVA
ncbi:hypothetical protein MKW94_010592 [Papaver nudicaule]|uniref:peptidylprolyl isomerase n=1 Tax=Papaver nudicaule TaxID=74823 RepID=A0AA41V749_PAPNU|nr:hypothetical protein [Papaver nudicaule]